MYTVLVPVQYCSDYEYLLYSTARATAPPRRGGSDESTVRYGTVGDRRMSSCRRLWRVSVAAVAAQRNASSAAALLVLLQKICQTRPVLPGRSVQALFGLGFWKAAGSYAHPDHQAVTSLRQLTLHFPRGWTQISRRGRTRYE